MASLLPGYTYDLFISYRHNDNRSGWVTEFARALQEELSATIKEPLSIYFDTNPHDGLLETHDVDESLKEKLRSLILIPIISQTYCDPKSFAWTYEFLPFCSQASQDQFGLKVKLPNANVASRVLPVKIHGIDQADQNLLESALGGRLRAIDFIFSSSGVNRPLSSKDERELNANKSVYRDQINKVANSVKEIIHGLQNAGHTDGALSGEKQDTPSNRVPFTGEINRRNVWRASLSYLLLALAFWQITSITVHLLDLSAGILKTITLLLIVFFPVSVVLAWLFERSPMGFIRSGSTSSLSNPLSPDQKKPLTSNIFLILMLATVIALFLAFPLMIKKASSSLGEVDPSLAVLPFDNLSKDPAQEYISDGLMEAVLSHLNQIEGLRLTSRTTMMTYKGTNKKTTEIAKEVGVRFVLEGSVQRVGNTIRINAQLIDGLNDNHVWSEYFDRQVSDLLNIQSEVAQQIADKLKVKVKPSAKANIEALPTRNAEAYDLFLKSLHPNNNNELEQARIQLEKAITLDPLFSSAYAQLGWYWMMQGFGQLSSREVIQKAEPLLNKACSLNPNEARTHVMLGYLNLWHKWDFYTSQREFNYAAQLEPSNPGSRYIDLMLSMGRFAEAVEVARWSIRIEPNNVDNKVALGIALYFDGQLDRAMQVLDSAWKTGKVLPSQPAYSDFGRTYVYLGRYESAIQAIENDLGDNRFMVTRSEGIAAIASIHLGHKDKGLELLNKLKKKSTETSVGSPSFYTAMVYAQLDQADLAFQCLEKGYADHEIEMYWLNVEPPFKPLHKDPRWQKMLDKIGFPKE